MCTIYCAKCSLVIPKECCPILVAYYENRDFNFTIVMVKKLDTSLSCAKGIGKQSAPRK